MNDNSKTKSQLINELNDLRQLIKRTGTSTDNVNHLELHAVRSILDASHALIALLDRDGKIIECNQAMLDRFGKSREELFGTSVWDNFSAEVTEKRKHMVAQVFETGEAAHIEDCRNGIWNDSIISPVFDENGTVTHVVVHALDITERKESEKSLILHEKMLQSISSNIPGAIFEFIRDKNGCYFMNYMSEGSEKLFGLPLEKLTGPISSEYIHQDDIEMFMSSIEDSAESLSEWEHEYRFRKPDGTYKWLKGKSLPQKKDDGSIVWKGVLIDVTKEKEIEETLRQSEKRFRTMFENHEAVMLLIEPDSGAIWKANTAAAQFYEYSIDELCSMSINDINMLSPEEVFAKRHNAKLHKENSFVFPHKVRSGVIRTVEVHSTPIHYEGSTILFSIIHDISDRKLAEEKLRENEKLLKNAQEVAHLGHYQIDIKTGKAIWSDETFRIFGLDPSDGEPTVESYQALLHPDDAPNLYQLFNESINEKKPFDMVYRIFHSSGEIRYVHSVGYMETNPTDKKDKMFGTLQDITERTLAEKSLAIAHSRLKALWGIASLSDADLHTISDYALRAIVDMTDSPYGFLGFLNDDESVMTIHSWSGDVMKDCEMTQQPTDFIITECGVWAEAVRRRKPLLLNDYSVPHDAKKGFPNGHVELSRLLVIPIITQGKIVSVAAVANRHSSYTDEDISQITALMTGIQNIIEERNTRKELQTSDETLREAQRVAHLGNWEWNIKQNTLKWSDEMYRIFGYEKDEFNEDLSDVLARSIHPDDLSEVERSNRSVIEHGKPIPLEYRIILPDGSVRTVWAKAGELILDEEGNPAVLSGIVQDSTERKRIQEQLQEREQYLSTILNTTVDGFWVLDNFGKIQEVNEAYCKMSGYKPDELAGMNIADIDADETPEETANRMNRIIVTGSEIFESRQRRKDGSIFPIEVSATYIRELGGRFVCFGRDLTEKKEAEEYLRKSRELLNETGDIARVGGWEIDLETDEVYWTQTTRKIHEVPDDYHPTVETAVKYFPGESGKKIIDAVTAAREKGIPYNLELEFETYTGQKRFVRALGKPIFEDGECVRLHGIFQDITELKIAEDTLRANEEKYRTLFENMMNGFALHEIVTDKTGNMVDYRIMEVNPAYERILGIDRKELLGKLATIAYETEEPPYLDTYAEVMQTGNAFSFETFFPPMDKYFSISVYKSTPTSFVTIFEDITRRRNSEKELEVAMLKYKTLFENFPQGITVSDENGKIIEANALSEKLLGITFQEHTDRDIDGSEWRIISPDGTLLQSEEYASVRALKENRAVRNQIMGVVKSNDEITWINVTATPMPLSGYGVVITYSDITAQKQAEEQKITLENQLRQAQKMEAVGRLAGGVAHDFNNMLNVILGNTELLMSEFDSDNPLFEDLQEIHKATERSSNLTRQLLAFARKQTITPQLLNLNETISGMLKMLQRLIGEDIKLVWMPGEEIWTVRMDPGQIDQILANLCVNSRDAITDVGMITIVTENTLCEQSFCEQNPGAIPGKYVKITVADTGKGMDEETLANAFEPFYTTKDINEGTGLGLSTVYGIAKQNNSFITISSQLGHGTSIELFMPRHIGKAEQLSKIPDKQTDATGNETILLVEDEKSLLRLGKRTLTQLGYEVLAAASPVEAIQIASEYSGIIQVLITDVVMPEMNGRDLAKRIISMYPDIKCLFMSGYTADVIAHRGVLDTGVNFIQKPYTKSVLAAKVEDMLRSEN